MLVWVELAVGGGGGVTYDYLRYTFTRGMLRHLYAFYHLGVVLDG